MKAERLNHFQRLPSHLHKRFAKVRSIIVSYFIHMRPNFNGSIFCTKNGKIDFEEINSMKCLVSVRVFLHQKIHMYQITLISNLVTDYIQRRRGEPEYNLLPKLISNFYAPHGPGLDVKLFMATWFEFNTL